MVLDLIDRLGPWTWWVFGFVLLGLEIFLPGTFFLWFGIAALVTGVVAFAADWGWQSEIILFVILALVFVIFGRRYFARREKESEDPLLNSRATRFIGNVYVLGEPIVTGHGRVRIDDTTWRVMGPDLPAGTRVRVTGAENTVLKVVAAE